MKRIEHRGERGVLVGVELTAREKRVDHSFST
jgi:hypothetical protein